MLGLTPEQRRTLADKLPDTGNLALGTLVFAQFLGDRPFVFMAAIAGVVLWALHVGGALLLGRRKSR